jgi:LysM repeat protein
VKDCAIVPICHHGLMRFVRLLLALVLSPLLAGCGYIHFGRRPEAATVTGDAALAQAYSSLGTEHKILKQELALARKEGDALRVALDRASGGSASPEMTERLKEATRELATLRASYAKLKLERPVPAAAGGAVPAARFSELEEKLAASLRGFTQLQEENARLRASLDQTRHENIALNEQLKTAVAQKEEARAELAQINTELLAQKEARNRAEQATTATRAQLALVLAQTPVGATAAAPTPRATSTTTGERLELAKAPPAGASAVAELRTSPDRIRGATTPGEAASAGTAPAGTPAKTGRVYRVQAGDSLAKIALQHYNSPDRWRLIYEANTDQLSGGRPLKPDMELVIPEP